MTLSEPWNGQVVVHECTWCYCYVFFLSGLYVILQTYLWWTWNALVFQWGQISNYNLIGLSAVFGKDWPGCMLQDWWHWSLGTTSWSERAAHGIQPSWGERGRRGDCPCQPSSVQVLEAIVSLWRRVLVVPWDICQCDGENNLYLCSYKDLSCWRCLFTSWVTRNYRLPSILQRTYGWVNWYIFWENFSTFGQNPGAMVA